jgi:octaprenyl-diphosphate synthase
VTNTLSLQDIYRPIEKDLSAFDEALREALSSKDAFMSEICDHLLKISGKHLRPALAILSSRLAGDKKGVGIQLGLAIELLHTATLVHDDIVDESMYRRNQSSVNARWGNDVALILGDFIYAKAYQALARVSNHNINQLFATCALQICEGEMKQIQTRTCNLVTDLEYFEMIWKKTAALFEAACYSGGYVMGLKDADLMSLAAFGKNLGLAFQIVDDCMDIIATEKELGKQAGLDLAKQDPTLPLIYLAHTLNGHGATTLEEALQLRNGADDFERIKALAIESGSVKKSINKAKAFAEVAIESIRKLPQSEYRKSLEDLADYTLQRVL